MPRRLYERKAGRADGRDEWASRWKEMRGRTKVGQRLDTRETKHAAPLKNGLMEKSSASKDRQPASESAETDGNVAPY